ncbi:MAG: radical SAM family heme chaperone HemW [bacterium]
MKKFACYIHVPFCFHKCIYCDFYSIIKHTGIEDYIISLYKEIDFYAEKYNKEYSISTIFFGGGTPSILEPKILGNIVNYLLKKFHSTFEPEITIEANPGTLNKEKLIELINIGINRLSIGVQSFDDLDLQYLTRIHTAQQAKEMICAANEAGFANINLDLIFNLPKQTKEKWEYNLNQAVNLPINHISCYSLIVEPGTILNKQILDGKVKINDEDYDADLYEQTIEFLSTRGFLQYEVSNFAKKGYECLHNKYYWEYNDYLGLGPSAHSFMDGVRWNNFTALNFYSTAIKTKLHAVMNTEILNEKQKTEEFVLMGLRSTGINIRRLELINNEWLNKNKHLLKVLEKDNYLKTEGNKIKLTSKGFPLCDEILLLFNY